jgi:hypothetical protein
MQIQFNHNFGQQEQGEIFHCTVGLVNVDTSEFDEALNIGFLIEIKDNEPQWYQSRSTRIRTSETNYKKYKEAFLMQAPYPLDDMDRIYNDYCEHKNFKKYFEVGQKMDFDTYMSYWNDHKMVGWAKLRIYTTKSIESTLFCWDYKKSSLSLGRKRLHHEIAWAKDQGYEFLYLGPGYEQSSIYKADLDGFEWWNGSYWSTDKAKYIELCKRDSTVKTLADLAKI